MPLPNEPTPPQSAPPPAGLPYAGASTAAAGRTPSAGATARATTPQRSRTLPADPDLPTADDLGAPATVTGTPRTAGPGGGGGGGGGPHGPQGPRRPAPPGATRRRPPATRPNYALRRTIALIILLTLLTTIWFAVKALVGFVGGLFSASDAKPGVTTSAPVKPAAIAPVTPEIPAPAPSPEAKQGTAGASDATSLVRTMRMASQSMSPKSIVAGPGGLLLAQNMMYHHSISVFRADGALLKTIPDSVTLSDFGITGHPGVSKGAPVEAAFTPDGKSAWVSNYSMYGSGFGPEGLDSCRKGDGTDTSYAYRVNTSTLAVDAVVPVGAVPKYVAITPDASKVLVSNWCSWSLSVIDATTTKETARIDLGGKYPRGIVVSPDSRTAYVALMGSQRIVAVDLATKAVSTFAEPGNGPRHLVMSPDGKFIYVTNNTSGTVAKIDRATGAVLATVKTASEPRSMAISSDGLAIYVVNYGSASMSKIRTSDMHILQTVTTDASPIGITYEPTKKQVWVACYGGSLIVFDDSKLKG
ncbi:YncE family protein [Nostocoides vanveenii]|uniref:YncE family protein n=1 Tax=Nostocoides vanveenii TaxID=330835 RepID=UPI0031DBECA7